MRNSSYYSVISSYVCLLFVALVATFMLSGCSSASSHKSVNIGKSVALIEDASLQKKSNSSEKLSVHIDVFQASKHIHADEKKLAEEDAQHYQNVRITETYFMSNHLKYTMQESGVWDSVQIDPVNIPSSDITVHGKIIESDGEHLIIKVWARDSTGKDWFRKTYSETAKLQTYDKLDPQKKDAFQNIYNQISNDLAVYNSNLTNKDIKRITTTTSLRYAEYFSPDTASGFLKKKGEHYTIQRLPAEHDKIFNAIERIKVRDELFLDVVNLHYNDLYHKFWTPYLDWRKARYVEVEKYNEATRASFGKSLLGLGIIAGSIALGASGSDNLSVVTLGVLGTVAGASVLSEGIQGLSSAQIHKEVIKELDESFALSSKPLRIKTENEVIELEGNLSEKYQQWRNILNQVYQEEYEISPVVH